MTDFSFSLEALPPFRLDLTVWTLRRRPHNLMDRWDGRVYRRVLTLQEQPVEVAVTQIDSTATPSLQVRARGIEPFPEATSFPGRDFNPDIGPPGRSHRFLSNG